MNNEDQQNPNSAWWQPAVEIFSQVSGYIVFPIILALVVGKSLDSYFGTKPWIFIGLAAFGFLVSCYGIVKVIKSYSQKLKELNDENNKS